MAIVVDLIKSYSPWVYGVCALVALWYLRAALVARKERRNSVFALERETALNRTYGVWAVAAILRDCHGRRLLPQYGRFRRCAAVGR